VNYALERWKTWNMFYEVVQMRRRFSKPFIGKGCGAMQVIKDFRSGCNKA